MRILHLVRKLLFPLSFVYGGVMAIRNGLYKSGFFKSYAFDVPVIGVGNLSVGGTGKTPHVEWIIRVLSPNCSLAVLSRGYGRKTKGFRWVNVADVAENVGDEPLQIKQKYPSIQVAVDEDRVHGIRQLLQQKHAPEVIVLDDAFQHRKVKPGLQILLDNFNRPIHRDLVLPAGNLREFKAGKKRADLVIVTKCEGITPFEISAFQKKYRKTHSDKLYFSHVKYLSPAPVFNELTTVLDVDCLKKSHVLVVTGIASPTAFEQYIAALSGSITILRFPDHHTFSSADELKIYRTFQKISAEYKYVITTEKDATRFVNLHTLKEQLARYCYYIPVQVDFLNRAEKQLIKTIENYVRNI